MRAATQDLVEAPRIMRLDFPVNVMFLIHKALRAEAAMVQGVVDELEAGSSLQRFKLAFNSWATALIDHAEREDRWLTAPPTDAQPPEARSRQQADAVQRVKDLIVAAEEDLRPELEDAVQRVLTTLNEEIGSTSLILRTKQHLRAQVVALRITQEDHLEIEEAIVLPVVRQRLNEREQLAAAKGLLMDEEAQDPRWMIDWVARALDDDERSLLAELEERFEELVASPR